VLEVVARRGRADGRRRRPRGARAAATVVGAPCRQSAALMRAPAGRLLRVWCVRRSCGRSRSGHRERGGGNQRGQQRTGKGKLTGDCSRRSSLPAGGGSSPVTAIGGARAGGRAWSG